MKFAGFQELYGPPWVDTPFYLRWLGKPPFRCMDVMTRNWVYASTPVPIGGINRQPCAFWARQDAHD